MIIVVLMERKIFGTTECLILDESLELIGGLRGFIFHRIMVHVELGRFSMILAPQLEVEIFPCLVLSDFVLLRMRSEERRVGKECLE